MGRRWDIAEHYFRNMEGWFIVGTVCLLVILICLMVLGVTDRFWAVLLSYVVIFLVVLFCSFIGLLFVYDVLRDYIEAIVENYEYAQKKKEDNKK